MPCERFIARDGATLAAVVVDVRPRIRAVQDGRCDMLGRYGWTRVVSVPFSASGEHPLELSTKERRHAWHLREPFSVVHSASPQ